MKNTLKYFLPALILIIFVGSCKKNHNAAPGISGQPGHIPGMGQAGGELQGTPFTLPATIEVVGQLKGRHDRPDSYCQITGSCGVVTIEVKLANHSEKDTVLILPAGLTFISENLEDQNGILLQEGSLRIAAGDTCRSVILCYCINAERHASSEESRYRWGPVTNAAPMLELIRLVKNKKLPADINDDTNASVLLVQGAVWNISDGKGLTSEIREQIANIPEK